MTEIGIRPARVQDADAIRDCIDSAYASTVRDIPDLPDVTGGIREDIEARDVFVAEQDGRVLGVVVFGETLEALMVFNLAIIPEARGQGLARALMQKAENSAAEVGLSILRLRTHRLMTNTRHMYLHLGWQERDVVENTVLMEKLV